eukprot:CAMPEP_0116925552 /NCGR_PEP_ID=MMETSP0467-20121206/24193_1 /TAXON_ID=283647 /ORGANISM="Mesodinium pulex, Strain SPMC105" /LENGTH=71 /DNA_ID=CAMNT_0004604631 /DNA_START=715 /DNA_END=930 /DNA_ORIENTATION=+
MTKAQAEKKSMELLSGAVNSKGGQSIIKIKMVQSYLDQMKKILEKNTCVIAPKESLNLAALSGIMKVDNRV